MNTIPYGRHHITEEDIQSVVEVLRSDYLTQGPKIEEFEKAFATYTGAEYAVAVSNGTAALHLCALSFGVEKGKNVITTPITFAASANCIQYCEGTVDFVDIDPSTALIDLNQIEDKLRKNPNKYSGVIPVDFAGLPVNLESLKAITEKFGLWIIEDACHAPGGYFQDSSGNDHHCGNGKFADLAIFSFHPVKHIATGEGGMVTTNNKKLYDKLLLLRTHGIAKNPDLMIENHGGWYYEMQALGYNYRLSDMQAALGISQLKRAEAGLKRRKEIAGIYDIALKDLPTKNLIVPDKCSHAYHLYIIRTSQRKQLYDFLRSKNVYCQVHYLPVHMHPYYQTLGFRKGDFPHAEKYYEECLSLPMYPSLADEEQQYVIECIREFSNF